MRDRVVRFFVTVGEPNILARLYLQYGKPVDR
jgi:hypothetical protein